MDINNSEMTIENLKQKIENQANLIKELTRENEELYHQYNHLIIRNGKLLQRIDDFQKIINEMHIRVEEQQLINGNMMQLNDKLRIKNDTIYSGINRTEKEYLNTPVASKTQDSQSSFDIKELSNRWKSYPGQLAQNEPNLRKQIFMLIHLYNSSPLGSADLFSKAGVGGVTGARYVSYLKKLGLICYTGARKKGHYHITQTGKEFLENKNQHLIQEKEKISKPENSRAKIFMENTSHRNEINIDHNDL
jgi:predicted transcriptional regulator